MRVLDKGDKPRAARGVGAGVKGNTALRMMSPSGVPVATVGVDIIGRKW